MLIHFISLGCDKNLVDSEVMLGIIHGEGYTLTADESAADVIVVNTCGFIADANAEGIETILRMAAYKTEGRCKALVVTGCMAQRYKETLTDEMPEIDAVVGVSDFEAIGDVIRKAASGERVRLISDNNRPLSEQYGEKRLLSAPAAYAYLKIAEGCDNCCTYCTIPAIRGKYRSRSMESIVAEAKNLAAQGVKELIVVAQDTALYGMDLYGENRLHALLAALSAIEGIVWIRLLYAYPEHLTDETIAEMASNPKICRYLDMPIQHTDDGVLTRMGRKSNFKQLLGLIEKLRGLMPDISLRTTLIVGFPGETDEAFQNLLDAIKQIKFDKLGVFEYSKEDGTAAATMKNQVPLRVKKRRKAAVMALQQSISDHIGQSQIGRTFAVVVEGKLPEEGVYCGRSMRDCPDVDGLVFFEYHGQGDLMTGDFVDVTITHCSNYDLVGEMRHEFAE